MSSRRKARATLLRALYLAECRGIKVHEAVREMEVVEGEMEDVADDPDALPLEPFALMLNLEEKEYVVDLGRKIESSRDEFNDYIKAALKNWEFERVPRIDRHIMWIAMAEMTYMLDVPVRASINEAVELAKDWSSNKSPSFINGMLDTIARAMGALK